MEIHILTEFHLKMTMIGDDIDKKVILPQILPISGPSLAQIMSKIIYTIIYTMVIQVLTNFQLEIIIIGEAIAKMVILERI